MITPSSGNIVRGIFLYSATDSIVNDLVISGNRITLDSPSTESAICGIVLGGAYLNNILVEKNIITKFGVGIAISSINRASNPTKDINIINNILNENSTGINIISNNNPSPQPVFQNITIAHNNIKKAVYGTDEYPIYLGGTYPGLIKNNFIVDNLIPGKAYAYAAGIGTSNRFRGNIWGDKTVQTADDNVTT